MLRLISTLLIFSPVWSRKRISLDPEALMKTCDLVRREEYHCEEHQVVTDDGYLLDIQRIPYGKTGPTRDPQFIVMLQHGLMSSSACWVENLANESLAFILADAGYDVWLSNSRGNTYGRTHKTLSPSQEEFWNFSWDEMATLDLPATVRTILSVTKQDSLFYVGHSQGSEIAFAALSKNTDLASKFRIFVALAPVAYLGHNKEMVRYLDNLPQELLYAVLGRKEFPPDSKLWRWLGAEICGEKHLLQLCFELGGYNPKEINASRIPVYLGHNPEGTSVKNMIHYTQGLRSGNFQMFDYGPKENMIRYKQSSPPKYNISNIRTKTALFAGSADPVTVPEDVAHIAGELTTLVGHKIIKGWGHMDFVWATHAPSLCYKFILELLRQYL